MPNFKSTQFLKEEVSRVEMGLPEAYFISKGRDNFVNSPFLALLPREIALTETNLKMLRLLVAGGN